MKSPASAGLIRSALIHFSEGKCFDDEITCNALAVVSAMNKACSLAAAGSRCVLISSSCKCVSYLSALILLLLKRLNIQLQQLQQLNTVVVFNRQAILS